MALAKPISTARSSSTTSSAASAPACARSSRSCAATYCGKIGVEYMHIQVPAERAWIQEKFEKRQRRPALSAAEKKEILEILTTAETFERFLDRRYTGTKRFGIEGAESLMPALEAILRRGSRTRHQGIRDRHAASRPAQRARQFCRQALCRDLFRIPGQFDQSRARPRLGRRQIPSRHLGRPRDRRPAPCICRWPPTRRIWKRSTRSCSARSAPSSSSAATTERREVAGILMHGDAAFAGQGLVAESLELSELTGFCTGGTIHVIVNNQIGFTTAPAAARSSPYPSDIAKGVQAPIFHVNGDDPGSGRRGRSRRRRIPPRIRQGRRRRPVLLSPPRPQRGRRAGLHPAVDVPHDRAPSDDPAALRRAAGRRRGSSPRARPRRWRRGLSPGSKASSRRPKAIARTRRIGSKAPGPGSARRSTTTAAATPRSRSRCCASWAKGW